MDGLYHDLAFALRGLVRRPAFSLTGILTLAIGIAASTAMFSIVDAALLRSLPFGDADRLLMLWGVAGPQRAVRGASYPEIRDWRQMNRSFQAVALYDETSVNLRTDGEPLRVEAEMVSANYFSLLGVKPQEGRGFQPADDEVPDRAPVAVISHALWQNRFAAARDIVGRTIVINDRPFAVVGVMPKAFHGLSFDTDLWVPSMMVSLFSSPSVVENRGSRWLAAVGRLAEGVSRDAAQRDMDDVAERLAKSYPATNRDRGVTLMSMKENYLGSTLTLLPALFGATVLLLLVAGGNVASLQLVRVTARRREIALRVTLGASRWRLVRQLLTESLLVGLLGGVAGVLLATWTLDGLKGLIPEGTLPRYADPSIDRASLVAAFLLSFVPAALFGLVPAFRAARQDVNESLKEGVTSARAGIGTLRRPGVQQALVVCQVALSLVLLVAAGLMVDSARQQMAVSPGFNPAGVTAARLTLSAKQYGHPERVRLANQLVQELQGRPGIGEATVASDLPFMQTSSASMLYVPGGPAEPIRYYYHKVTPSYFTTLGVPLLAGRGFADSDNTASSRVVIVNDAMAQRYWGGAQAAVGRQVRFGTAPDGPDATIVGVAGNARFRDLTTNLAGRTEPDVYLPFGQVSDRDLQVAVRSRNGATIGASLLQSTMATIDPTVPFFAVQRLEDALWRQTAVPRCAAVLLAAFAGMALLLAGVGIYGLVAFIVGLSRREIAIRMALGSNRTSTLRLVVLNTCALILAGLALGIAGGLAASRLLASQLFRIPPHDAPTFAAMSLLLLVVGGTASLLPALRAVRIDPQSALRAE